MSDPTDLCVWDGEAARPMLPPLLLAPRPRRADAARGDEHARNARRGEARAGPSTIPVLISFLIAGSMAALAAREPIVRRVPELGAAYAAIGLPVNPLGLTIEDVHARMGEFGARKVLLVDGAILNQRAHEAAPPELRIVLRGADGRELYRWTTRSPKSTLAKSERVRFTARLEAPPEDVVDAVVNFVGATENSSGRAEGS
jgi:hypothetical protein